MDKDPTITVDMNPDVKVLLSKIHALTTTRYKNFEKLRELDVLREEAHVKYRILIEDNMANFKKEFPNASRALWAEFQKVAFENTILDDLNAARKKQEIVYTASRDKLEEMYKTFNNLFPQYIPQDIQNRKIVSFPGTDSERVVAFFRTCSPEDVAREIFTHKALPGFKIYSCEKSFNRDDLPPSYRAKFERARQFPDDPDHLISYDTPGVTEKMRKPQRRKAKDIFTTTLETVWVYNSDVKKYERHIHQQVFHKYSKDEVNGLRRRLMIYVEISIVDVE
ncbi:uncharacterized protein EAF01_000960 [Botrytis porri]|uniref:Uncharacterized protein n=1 Tax=Botrytis porri TaxID=87229 RepID=A0A4Z1KXT4_9HELO|nr:uncharacterized protein EAF01_000960 [Botrytis porri]KAF7914554.1 hypothetical protein EAF01_000960 [Botrytis porri]TGO89354.1 hypothetical protein BPOR_0113g00070 [Botrytis porri]